MKIAIFHELPKGGARRAINEFARNLKENHQVHLFTTDEKTIPVERAFFTKSFLFPFKTKEWHGKNWRARLYKDSIELLQLYFLHKRIAKFIDESNYDFVFVGSSKYIEAPFILRFVKSPSLFYCSDPSYRILYEKIFAVSKKLDFFRYYYERGNRLLRKILDRDNVHAARFCYAPSAFIAQKFTYIYKKKNDVLYYGVDSDFFSSSNQKKDIDIFYIGSYDPVDGLDLLKEAIRKMKYKPTVRMLIAEEEWISDDKELRELYRRSKIMVCPARNEGLGAGPMEAMSCGVAVVAVNEAGHKEIIIDNRTGFLVARRANDLAEKLDYLFSHPQKIAKIGKQASTTMKTEWSWKNRTNELEKIMSSIIAKQ